MNWFVRFVILVSSSAPGPVSSCTVTARHAMVFFEFLFACFSFRFVEYLIGGYGSPVPDIVNDTVIIFLRWPPFTSSLFHRLVIAASLRSSCLVLVSSSSSSLSLVSLGPAPKVERLYWRGRNGTPCRLHARIRLVGKPVRVRLRGVARLSVIRQVSH